MNTDRTPTRFPPLPDVPPEAWEDRMNDWPDRTPTEPYCEECRHHPGRSLHATHARTPTTAAGRRLVADATDHPIWASAMLGYVLAIEAEAAARTSLHVLTLAAIIRRVDGNHDLGAAALAEAIFAALEEPTR